MTINPSTGRVHRDFVIANARSLWRFSGTGKEVEILTVFVAQPIRGHVGLSVGRMVIS